MSVGAVMAVIDGPTSHNRTHTLPYTHPLPISTSLISATSHPLTSNIASPHSLTMSATPTSSGEGDVNTGQPPPTDPLPSNSTPLELSCACLNVVIEARAPGTLCQRVAHGPSVFIKGNREKIYLPPDAEVVVSVKPCSAPTLRSEEEWRECVDSDNRNTANWRHSSASPHSTDVHAEPQSQRRQHRPQRLGASAGCAGCECISRGTARRQTRLQPMCGSRLTLPMAFW